MLTTQDANSLTDCLSSGGIAIFPTDTVYGIGCNPGCHDAVQRIYELKGRPEQKPAAVLFFSLNRALATLEWLGLQTQQALKRLLPGPVMAVVPNPLGLYPLAAGGSGIGSLGLRVPLLKDPLAALATVEEPVLQTSANISGGSDARRLADIPLELRHGVDLLLDGGELPGVPSTVVDLTNYEREGAWQVLRSGAVADLDLDL